MSHYRRNSQNVEYTVVESDMTLRDWFAGQAPSERAEFPSPEAAAEFAGVQPPKTLLDDARLAAAVQAKLSYIWADAMLAERAK